MSLISKMVSEEDQKQLFDIELHNMNFILDLKFKDNHLNNFYNKIYKRRILFYTNFFLHFKVANLEDFKRE